MVLTEHARRYLIAEGIRPETIIKTGSSMKEVLKCNEEQIKNSDVLKRLGIEKGKYFVLSMHREENVDNPKNFESLIDAINKVAETYKMPIIFSAHPRTRKKIEAGNYKFNELVNYMKPLGFNDYNCLQQNAFCVISDSGTITEESSIMGFPAITVRQAHERPEGMDEGTLIMSGVAADDILDSIKVVTSQESRPHIVDDYDVDHVGSKVVKIIMSYTGYINRTVWRKY